MTSFEYSTTASSKRPSSQPKVFINFQEGVLSHQFVGHLVADLKSYLCIDVEKRSGDLSETFQMIKESKIALVIFSSMYTTSSWCLNELVEIKQRVEERKLVVIPIFYKLDASVVKRLEGDFGLNLWNHVKRTSEFEELKIWKEALDFVSQETGLAFSENSEEAEFLTSIVKEVKRQLIRISADEANSDASPNLQNAVESKRVESVKEDEKYVHGAESSNMATYDKHVPQHQVFINFRGEDLRSNFVSHLVSALLRKEVNVFIDKDEDIAERFKKIEDSKIALVIFSSRFSESIWCLDELVKIKERMDEGKLRVIPISYKVEPLQVKQLNGDFGNKLWNLWRLHRDHHIIKWKEALESIASLEAMTRLCLKENSPESAFVTSIVEEVNKVLTKIPLQEGQNPSCYESGKCTTIPARRREEIKPDSFFGMEKRMEQLEQKLELDHNETRIIGVVGMPGIGKTTLAMMMHEKWNCKFVRCVPLLGIRKKSKDYGLVWLRTTLLKVLLGGEIPNINDDTTHESVKNELLQTKVFVVLDDVSDKKQIEFLLGDLKWIKRGSRIVITTCDKSLLAGLAHDTYLVPQMDNKEAFEHFSYHALDDQICSSPRALLTRSRLSVDNAGGNPLALKLMARELCGEHESYSEHILQTAMHVWKYYIDQLNERQKDVFLDIVCFFKSEDEYFVRSILDSGDPDSKDAVSEVKDLVDKFLITISDGRVEMNDLVYTYGKHLGSPPGRLEKNGPNVRGIFLDMSDVTESIPLENKTNLRYLKIYDSFCPRQCKLNISHGFEFPLKEVRYLHWEKFPLDELPSDFVSENLVDLRLPYSKITHVWEGIKDTPRLKWIDLSYSKKLVNISALSKAENLLSINLEGCVILNELPLEIQNMKSLAFLNLRGCICLKSFPEMNLISLKTLILTDCSRLTEFHLISESLENLHLDGTSIKGLPPTIKNSRRLILLNLRNCKLLEFLPISLCELKDLEELILSGCSNLENFSDVKHAMKHLQTLRLDGTGAKEMLNILSKSIHDVNGVSLLQRLCLRGNDFVSLQIDISKLYNLKWLDVKQCKKLTSIPMLPPRLEYFDARGCESLEKVANPLALLVVTQQIYATFNFTNCNKLDQEAKDSIISYTRLKSQLVLNELSRYNAGFISGVLIGTCFPGWTVPAWFSHQAIGSELKPKLPPHWCDKFTGIALCVVILSDGNHDQNLLVKCNCEFKNEDGLSISFSFTIGGWSESGNIESYHVLVGYISKMDINKHGVGINEEGCICTEVSLAFQVTDGTKEMKGCEVKKCGFSLVYASHEMTTSTISNSVEKPKMHSFVGVELRLKQLEKVLFSTPGKTRIIGVVGDPGIGKTTLATILFEKRGCKFPNNLFLRISKERSLEKLRRTFLEELLKHVNQTVSEETTHEYVKDKLLQAKSFIVLDGVTDRKQLEFLLGNLNWIKKGSKIIITTRDMSLLEGFAHETYMVPELNKREAFQLFTYHAFDDQICSPTRTFLTLSKIIVDNTRGNPSALELFGSEHHEKDEAYWKHTIKTMKQNDVCYIDKLKNMGTKESNNVIGVYIDMSEVTKKTALKRNTFINMSNLRYLNIYNSYCPRQRKADCTLNFPDGLRFPLEEVQYLNWEKFPLEELPSDFRPENLVSLRLPYSKIARIWEGFKDTPRLKWIDLSYSKKLVNISALSKAENLLSINLEGCLNLDELPLEIQNMKSLALLNLRGCICLKSFPEINLISLKTLILTDCSSLTEFQLISESLENLHLDGTSIKGLPLTIKNLRRLVLLNLRNYKMLEFLPDSLCELKDLEEVILSGCSSLKNLPDVKHGMKHLQILLFDGTGANEMPKSLCFTRSEGQVSADMLLQPSGPPRDVNGVSLLQRLCLSGNNFVSLQSDIRLLYNLKWLEVKQCKRLRSVPMLPPRLEYFDAHGCDSLERVANPLALLVVTENMHATFNFTNCNKLDQEAKDSIISYTRRKSHLVLDSLARYNGDIALEALFGTCFPGWEVPVWFSHRVSGSVLAQKLPPHWFDNRFIGIALCAVIQFPSYNDQNNLSVKCSCVFKNENGSRISLTCTIGGWSESSNLPKKIESSHVFIGYLRRFDINKQEEGCVFNKTSLEFKVTDATGEVVVGCDVMKCGFGLVHAPNERENICWDAKTVETENVSGEEPILLGKSRSDNDIQYRPTEKLESDDYVLDPCSLSPERVRNVLDEVIPFGKSPRNNKIKYQPHSSRMPRSGKSRKNNKIKYQAHSSRMRRSSSFDMMQIQETF